MTDQPPPQPPRAPVSRSGLPSSHPGSSSPWRSAASASEESLGLVIARPEGALVDLRLRKFDPRDIEAIKSIPGRRWVPGRKVWTVPNDRTTIELLTRAFGPRLLLGPDAAGDSSSTGRIRQTRPPSSERPAPRPARSDILEALSLAVRTREYSPRTERAYLAWARRFLEFDPSFAEPGARLDPARGKAFLEHLATDARLGAKTRNQAASALGFIFREVLGPAGFEDVRRAKRPRRLPSVRAHRAVRRGLRGRSGDPRRLARLQYSAGRRLEECLHVRG
jgi:hypothetical protein